MKPKNKAIAKSFAYFFLIIIIATFIFSFAKFWMVDAGIYTDTAKYILSICFGASMVVAYRFLSKRIDKAEEQHKEK